MSITIKYSKKLILCITSHIIKKYIDWVHLGYINSYDMMSTSRNMKNGYRPQRKPGFLCKIGKENPGIR